MTEPVHPILMTSAFRRLDADGAFSYEERVRRLINRSTLTGFRQDCGADGTITIRCDFVLPAAEYVHDGD